MTKKLALVFMLLTVPAFSQGVGGGGVPGRSGATLDTRPSVIQTTGKGGGGTGTPLNAGSSLQVFNVTGAGTITFLHFTIGPSGGDITNLMTNSTVTINCDGNPQTVPWSGFFLSQDTPAAFENEMIGVPASPSGQTNATYNRRTQINFFSSCTITLNNASATSSANVFFDTAYRSGSPSGVGPASRSHWNTFTMALQRLAPNTNAYNFPQVYALPSTTFSGGGELESVQEYFNSAANYSYMESTPVVTADSSVAAQANGHEDFYSSGYYCNAAFGTASSVQDQKWGCFLGSGLQNKVGAFDSLFYRWFTSNPADNLLFNSSLSISSANGGNNFGSPGTVNWDSLVTYFTGSPTVAQINYSPLPGRYSSTQSVTLSGGPSGDTICYTTDGSTVPVPNGSGGCSAGTPYSTPVSVSSSATVKAVGGKSGYNSSPVTAAAYSIVAYSSPTYRQECNNTESGSGTTTVTCTMTVTAGDFAFVMCRSGQANVGSFTATSSPSNSFTQMAGISNSSGGSQASYAFGLASGSTTFTCTAPQSVIFQGIVVLEYSPGSVTSLAAGAPNTINSSTSTFTSAPISTTSSAFWIVCADAQFGPPTPTAGNINGSAATGRTMASSFPSFCEDLSVVSAATNATGTMTTGTSGNWDGAIAAFY